MITRDTAAFLEYARSLAADAGPACAKAAFLVAPEGFALAEQSASDNAYMDLGVGVDPARAVGAYAASLPAKLVMTSTHGEGGLLRTALGSVALRIAHHAPCPVVVRRPPDAG